MSRYFSGRMAKSDVPCNLRCDMFPSSDKSPKRSSCPKVDLLDGVDTECESESSESSESGGVASLRGNSRFIPDTALLDVCADEGLNKAEVALACLNMVVCKLGREALVESVRDSVYSFSW